MVILLYIFLGLLIFDCLIACRLYFLKEHPFKQSEDQLNYLKTAKSTQDDKNAKGKRISCFCSPIIRVSCFRLKSFKIDNLFLFPSQAKTRQRNQ